MSGILLANHEATTLKIMTKLLRTEGYKVVAAEESGQAKDRLGSEEFSLVIAGVGKAADAELELIKMVKDLPGPVPVIALVGRDEELEARVAELDPYETIGIPLKVDKLLTAVQAAVDYHDENLAQNVNLNLQLETLYQFEDIVAESPSMKSVCDMVSRVAATDVTVMIMGEDGTGKSLLARAVHDSSKRSDQPFVALNCEGGAATLSADIFGDGATPGALEKASGGTLFLREISNLPSVAQGFLATALHSRTFKRMNSGEDLDLDIRLVGSTSKDLAALVAEGKFNEKLHNLIKIILIKIPPLRDRKQDVMPTVRKMLRQIVGEGKALPALDSEVTEILEGYAWPENVSEMEAVLKEALSKLEDGKVVKASLPDKLL